MHGCAFGSGDGSYIFGGDGNDKVYIGRDTGKTYVSGGKGDDTVHVAGDTSFGVAASVLTNPVGAIAVGALVLAAIMIWVLARFAVQSGAKERR